MDPSVDNQKSTVGKDKRTPMGPMTPVSLTPCIRRLVFGYRSGAVVDLSFSNVRLSNDGEAIEGDQRSAGIITSPPPCPRGWCFVTWARCSQPKTILRVPRCSLSAGIWRPEKNRTADKQVLRIMVMFYFTNYPGEYVYFYPGSWTANPSMCL